MTKLQKKIAAILAAAGDLSIALANKPSHELMVAAVRHNGSNIRYVKNPGRKLQMIAVRHSAKNIVHIQNPDPKVLMYIKMYCENKGVNKGVVRKRMKEEAMAIGKIHIEIKE